MKKSTAVMFDRVKVITQMARLNMKQMILLSVVSTVRPFGKRETISLSQF